MLDSQKAAVEEYFPPDHPARYSNINNQALLHKVHRKLF